MPYIVVVVLLAVVQSTLAKDWHWKSQAKQQDRQIQNPRQGRRGFQGGQKQYGQQFDKWLDKLTKAYEDNDKEKMGKLIEKMHQRRETMRQRRGARSEFRQGIRHRGYGQRGRPGRFQGGQDGWGQSRPHRRTGRQGRYYQHPDLRKQQQDSEGFDWDW